MTHETETETETETEKRAAIFAKWKARAKEKLSAPIESSNKTEEPFSTTPSLPINTQPSLNLCDHCGELFTPKKVRQRFCSDACRIAANKTSKTSDSVAFSPEKVLSRQHAIFLHRDQEPNIEIEKITWWVLIGSQLESVTFDVNNQEHLLMLLNNLLRIDGTHVLQFKGPSFPLKENVSEQQLNISRVFAAQRNLSHKPV